MNTGIFAGFRIFGIYKLNIFPVIVINYVTCIITGLLFIDSDNIIGRIIVSNWKAPAFVLGAMFIITFYLMAITTQRFSISVSSIASKMSLAIPVAASIFIFNVQSKEYDIFNYIGILAALPAIYLVSRKNKESSTDIISSSFLKLLPLGVFLFSGIIDTMINYLNLHFLPESDQGLFLIAIFGSAATIGVLTIIIKKIKITFTSIIGGFLLGFVNYFSVYFLLKSLSEFGNDGALVFPLVNVGIVLLSAFVSIFVFNERLQLLNKIGLLVAMIAIILISYQEMMIALSN